MSFIDTQNSVSLRRQIFLSSEKRIELFGDNLTSEKKESKSKAEVPSESLLRLPFDRIEQLHSGSCFFTPTEKGDKVVVCKEGKIIKIFKLEEEKK